MILAASPRYKYPLLPSPTSSLLPLSPSPLQLSSSLSAISAVFFFFFPFYLSSSCNPSIEDMCLLVCVEEHMALLRMIEARSPISNALSCFALCHLFSLFPLPEHVDILLAPRFPVEVCTGLLWTRVGVHLRELPKRYSTLS